LRKVEIPTRTRANGLIFFAPFRAISRHLENEKETRQLDELDTHVLNGERLTNWKNRKA
jgi:hypothetical protein